MKKRHHQNRSGVLLVTVVTMLAVVTLMLSQLASRSMRTAQQAVLKERELRKRWESHSVRSIALSEASRLLREESLVTGTHVRSIERRVLVGNDSYRVVISDESAKVNLPLVRLALGTEAAVRIMGELSSTRLRSNKRVSDPNLLLGKRWEDWFDLDSLGSRVSVEELARGTNQLTLWGREKLNLARCSPQAIDALWRELLSRPAPEELLEVPSEFPTPAISAVLARLSLRESELNAVEPWLTTESESVSVWVFPGTNSQGGCEFTVKWGAGRAKSQRSYSY